MTREFDDEEAFHWAGDEVGGREGSHLPSTVPDATAGSPADVAAGGPISPSPRGVPVTVVFGIGYLALTVGWILATGFTSAGTTDLVAQVLWQFGEFTAIVAAPLWFGTSVLLTPGRLGVRSGWLALGLGVLVPWPLLPAVVTL